MGGDVACAAGISVHAPGATDVRATFQNHVRARLGLLQANGYAKTAEAAADDQTFKVRSHGRHQFNAMALAQPPSGAVRIREYDSRKTLNQSMGKPINWSDEELLALARRQQANDMAVQG